MGGIRVPGAFADQDVDVFLGVGVFEARGDKGVGCEAPPVVRDEVGDIRLGRLFDFYFGFFEQRAHFFGFRFVVFGEFFRGIDLEDFKEHGVFSGVVGVGEDTVAVDGWGWDLGVVDGFFIGGFYDDG